MIKTVVLILGVAILAACASTPAPPPPPEPAAPEDLRATEVLMTDPKFQDGLDAAMAGGTSLEPFLRQLAQVPPSDESRVLMTALLEEEARRRPLIAPPLFIPAPESTSAPAIPAPLSGETRSAPESGWWKEQRLMGAILGVAALGLLMSAVNYKLVITTP